MKVLLEEIQISEEAAEYLRTKADEKHMIIEWLAAEIIENAAETASDK